MKQAKLKLIYISMWLSYFIVFVLTITKIETEAGALRAFMILIAGFFLLVYLHTLLPISDETKKARSKYDK